MMKTMPMKTRWLTRSATLTRAAVAALAALATQAAAAEQDGAHVAETFAEQLATTRVELEHAYAGQRPRLLFDAGDVEALRDKAAAHPQLWDRVLRSSRGLGDAPPADDAIRDGTHYWRIERVQAGALAHVVTGEQRHLDAAARWMVAHAGVDTWGTGYRPNVDLEASWYLYHIAIAYDLLHGRLDGADQRAVRDGLIAHARAIHDSFEPDPDTRWRFDQNHTYIPATALAAAALALIGETPEAEAWLNRAYAMMRRARYALGEDGYYYEGTGYWSYALHWHVRYAELIARATGEPGMTLPILQNNDLFARHMSLPGVPNFFDVGDTGRWTDRPDALNPTNHAMLWAIASHLEHPRAQAVGDWLAQRHPETVYHAAAFLWYDPDVEPAVLDELPPYHHFEDHGIVAWRSGWGDDASVYLFRVGPSQGHAAAQKLDEMRDWTMNAGHVHPDIGAFWMYARGEYLVSDTGYVTEKHARDHNTLLVSGQGQGVDGSYWYERGWPYERFNQARIERVHLEEAYGYVRGSFASVYPDELGELDLHRTLVMTHDWLLVIDELTAERPQTLTWLAHSVGAFSDRGAGHVLVLGDAQLGIVQLDDTPMDALIEPAVVMAGTAPGRGEPTQRGHRMRRTTAAPARQVRLVHLLAPTVGGEAGPEAARVEGEGDAVHVRLTWPDGRTQVVHVDPADESAPVRIER
ncbi:MAG: DUF4962 domain-containing protein [Phycisphaeraceae bacterium]